MTVLWRSGGASYLLQLTLFIPDKNANLRKRGEAQDRIAPFGQGINSV